MEPSFYNDTILKQNGFHVKHLFHIYWLIFANTTICCAENSKCALLQARFQAFSGQFQAIHSLTPSEHPPPCRAHGINQYAALAIPLLKTHGADGAPIDRSGTADAAASMSRILDIEAVPHYFEMAPHKWH
jgi:hypothetical protein